CHRSRRRVRTSLFWPCLPPTSFGLPKCEVAHTSPSNEMIRLNWSRTPAGKRTPHRLLVPEVGGAAVRGRHGGRTTYQRIRNEIQALEARAKQTRFRKDIFGPSLITPPRPSVSAIS